MPHVRRTGFGRKPPFFRAFMRSRSKRPRQPNVSRLALERFEDRCLLAGSITGLAYQDFNGNGIFDTSASVPDSSGTGTIGLAVDRGISGVTVTAYDRANVVQGTAVTGPDGTFTLTAGGTGPYRVEFTNLPAGFYDGAHGRNSGTTVQFVPDGNSTVDLALSRPPDYSQDNPTLIANCYVFGDQINGPNQNLPVIIGFPYAAGAPDADTSVSDVTNPSTHTLTVPAKAVGTTWGLGYNRFTQTAYAAALMKRHSGFGPNGTGAIYQISSTTGAASLFVDLNAVFGPGTAGTDPHNHADYITDNFNATWDAVGKLSLGGLDVSDDGKRLYVMNLADRNLYEIPLDAPPTAANIRRVPIPMATVPHATGGGNDIRPWAVRFYQGQIYVGLVNSAESTQNPNDLWAYVYRVDPVTLQFSAAPVFQVQLNFPRGQVFRPPDGAPANWLPWSPHYANVAGDPTSWAIYPQPILSGIAFDATGNMVLGMLDRNGDQTGYNTPEDPANPTTFVYGMSGGDTLRAFINTAGNLNSGWTLESNGRGPLGQGGGPQNTGKGPGGAEFYFQGNYSQISDDSYIHDHVTLGGVTQIPGYPDVVVSVFNPNRNNPDDFFSGGFRWFNNAVGNNDKSYELFTQNSQFFGKAGGIGETVALVNPAPIEIGNRVWKDLNGNGIQDADEPAIPGVTVNLYDATGTVLIASAVTDANGDYYFSSAPGTSTASERYGLNLLPNTNYQIRIDTTQGALKGCTVTKAFADSSPNGASRDSNAVLSGTNAVIAVTTGGYGVNDHTLDAGFVPLVDLGVTKTVDNATPFIGDTVTFTVTLTDFGPGNGTNITVTDPLPAGLTFVAATTSAGTYTSSTGVWFVPQLANGASATLTISAVVVGSTIPPNVATITHLDQVDTNPANNQASVTIFPSSRVTPPAKITGFVYVDANDNGVKDAGEAPIPGVTLTLTGTTTAGQRVTFTTTTGPDGSYTFLNLEPGKYTVSETQPVGYLPGKNAVGTVNGVVNGTLSFPTHDVLANIMLAPGDCGQNYNFGELLFGKIEGVVYVDANRNGVFDAGELGIPGVSVTLSGTDDLGSPVLITETTAANGTYAFCNLRPGTYKLSETQPVPFLQGSNHVGSLGGTLVPVDMIAGIPVASGVIGTAYDFGEGDLKPEFISKGLYLSSSTVASIMGNPVPPPWSIWKPLAANDIVTGSDAGGTPLVRVSDAHGNQRFSFDAYTPAFHGGVRVAVADVNGDGIPDIITAAGPGGGPHVKVFDGRTGQELFSFMAYDASVTTGLFVAAGDVDGDGFADIITGPDIGGGPHVKVFSGRNPAVVLRSFFAYTPTLLGGVRVAAADINGDGLADIITGAGPGGGPHVKVFSGQDNSELRSFFAYAPSFAGGVYVAAGDVNGDGTPDIITGSGQGVHVKAFDGRSLAVIASFFAYDPSFLGGVRVAAVDVNGNGRADILTAPGSGGGPHVKAFDGLSLALLDSFFAADAIDFGGLFIGAAGSRK